MVSLYNINSIILLWRPCTTSTALFCYDVPVQHQQHYSVMMSLYNINSIILLWRPCTTSTALFCYDVPVQHQQPYSVMVSLFDEDCPVMQNYKLLVPYRLGSC